MAVWLREVAVNRPVVCTYVHVHVGMHTSVHGCVSTGISKYNGWFCLSFRKTILVLHSA